MTDLTYCSSVEQVSEPFLAHAYSCSSYFVFSAFNVDDHLNEVLADWYGIVMGTSHEEPMMRSIPVEWSLFGVGDWDYSSNAQFIYNFWVNSTERAEPFENIFTLGMRGDGDCTFSQPVDRPFSSH